LGIGATIKPRHVMRAKEMAVALAISGLALFGAVAVPVPVARAAFPGRDGQIAYGTVLIEEEEGPLGLGPIEAVSPLEAHHPSVLVNGEALAPVGSSAEGAKDPSYSADGSQIAFAAGWEPPGSSTEEHIFVMSASGEEMHQVTKQPGVEDDDPGFSPSGTRIVFDRTDPETHDTQIYAINADGSEPTQLTSEPNADNVSPRFSPDGKHIVYDSKDGIDEISPDGSGRHLLVSDRGRVKAYEADFSPTGKLITFVQATTKKGAVLIAKANGTDARRISPRQKGGDQCFRFYCPSGPVFSPDGRRVLYELGNVYGSLLAEVRITGKPRESDLDLPGGDNPFRPSWQPLPH
jgi:Tol biopolymer transport system component